MGVPIRERSVLRHAWPERDFIENTCGSERVKQIFTSFDDEQINRKSKKLELVVYESRKKQRFVDRLARKYRRIDDREKEKKWSVNFDGDSWFVEHSGKLRPSIIFLSWLYVYRCGDAIGYV